MLTDRDISTLYVQVVIVKALHSPPLVRGGPGAKRRGRGRTIVQIENEKKGNLLPGGCLSAAKAGGLIFRHKAQLSIKIKPEILPDLFPSCSAWFLQYPGIHS